MFTNNDDDDDSPGIELFVGSATKQPFHEMSWSAPVGGLLAVAAVSTAPAMTVGVGAAMVFGGHSTAGIDVIGNVPGEMWAITALAAALLVKEPLRRALSRMWKPPTS